MGIRRFLLILAALVALAAPSIAMAGPGDFVGIYSEDAFYRAPDYRDATFAEQAAAGIGLERIPFDWREIETSPGVYDFTRYDAFVGSAARAGLEVLPVVGDAPLFRSGAPSLTPTSVWYPPQNAGDYAQFVTVLMARYGRQGSFWAAHPELPAVPITNWQIWNEPNLPMFWGFAPNAGQYAALLRAADTAVHVADPSATVVAAGMPESSSGVPLGEYVDELYAAGFRGTFDVFALHGYAPGLTGTVDMTAYARELLDQHGDHSPIWLTEFGWATGGSSAFLTVSETEQAKRIAYTLSTLWQERSQLGLRGVVIFKWRDSEPPPGLAAAWPMYAGLLRVDGSPKPALQAAADAIAAMRPADTPDTTGSPSPADPPGPEPSSGTSPEPVQPAEVNGGLRVRWVELAGRRARLHVTCANSSTACSGRVSAAVRRVRGARRFRVLAGARSVLALTLSRRVPSAWRWIEVRVEPGAAQQFLIRRLRSR